MGSHHSILKKNRKSNSKETKDQRSNFACMGMETIQSNHFFHENHSKMKKEIMNHYQFGKVLGQGGSAKVYLAQHKVSGISYACKIIEMGGINSRETLETEISIMQSMLYDANPYIITTHEIYQTPKALWIFLEYADQGSLQDYIAKIDGYNETTASKLFRQILEAIQYLHENGIVHRDVKIENILIKSGGVDDEPSIKVSDFGLSAKVDLNSFDEKQLRHWKNKKYNKLIERWGTKENFAPEVYRKAYGPQADVWSLGCILIEILTGRKPFRFSTFDTGKRTPYHQYLDALMGKQYSFESWEEWHSLSRCAKDLVLNMLQYRPEKRYSVTECLQHPWITGAAFTDPSLCKLRMGIRSIVGIYSKSSNLTESMSNSKSFTSDEVESDECTVDASTAMKTLHVVQREMMKRAESNMKYLALQMKSFNPQ